MYYDTNINKRQTRKHLARRGLDSPEVNLAEIGIIDLVKDHGIDTDLYTVTDTREVEITDDAAHVIFDQAPKDTPEIRRLMKDKVHARRDIVLYSGIDFAFEGVTHTLQTRSAGELLAWDKTRAKAKTLPVETPIRVRDEADNDLFIPAAKLVVLLDHMEDFRMQVMDASWTFKNAIDNAPTDAEAFTAYESGIDTVWPDDSPINIDG